MDYLENWMRNDPKMVRQNSEIPAFFWRATTAEMQQLLDSVDRNFKLPYRRIFPDPGSLPTAKPYCKTHSTVKGCGSAMNLHTLPTTEKRDDSHEVPFGEVIRRTSPMSHKRVYGPNWSILLISQ